MSFIATAEEKADFRYRHMSDGELRQRIAELESIYGRSKVERDELIALRFALGGREARRDRGDE